MERPDINTIKKLYDGTYGTFDKAVVYLCDYALALEAEAKDESLAKLEIALKTAEEMYGAFDLVNI